MPEPVHDSGLDERVRLALWVEEAWALTATSKVTVTVWPLVVSFGKITATPAWDVAGFFVGSDDTVQLVVVLPQPTLNAGFLSGVLLLPLTLSAALAVILACSPAWLAHTAIRTSTVSFPDPVAADDAGGDALARTVTPEGLLVTVASPPYPTRAGDALAVGLVLWVVGAGLLGWVCVDGVGDGVGGADELAAPGELVVVAGFVVLGVVLGAAEVFEAEASGADLAEVAGLEALAGVVEREGVGDAVVAEVGGFGVLDAVGAGLAARAAVVTLPEMTKRPVASPRVTGRECADRIRAPCPCRLSRRDSAPGVNVPHVAQGCL